MTFTDKRADYAATCFIVVSSGSSFVAAVLLIISVFIADKRQREAYAGDVVAGAKLILPVYRPLFQGLAALFVFLSVAQLCTLVHNYTIYQVFYVLQYHTMCLVTVYLISPVLLIQHSISTKAFYTTFGVLFPYFVILSLLWGASVHEYNKNQPHLVKILQLTFTVLGFLPPFCLCVGILGRFVQSRVQLGSKSNRSSSEFLLLFCVMFFIINMYQSLNSNTYSTTTAFYIALVLVIITFAWNCFFAFSLHRSLLADTKYWRGIGTHNRLGLIQNSAVARRGSTNTLVTQGGVNDPRDSSQSNASQASQSSVVPKPTMDMSVASTHFQDMMANIGKITIDFAYLEIKKKIGDGASAKVFSGVFKGENVAVKVSTPAEITAEVIDVFVKEGLLSMQFQHRNVVRFHGLCVRPPQIAMVMELCSKGNLKSSLKSHASYWTQLKRMEACLEAARGLAYMHVQGYIHRDLKTENFFLSENFEVKLGDFGESTRIQTKDALGGRRMTILGTVSYMAPEVIAAAKYYTTAIDVYALGITFWEVATGEDAHADRSQFEIYSTVGAGKRPDISKIPSTYPEEFVECINAAWDQEADKRPTAQELAIRLEQIVVAAGGSLGDEAAEAEDTTTRSTGLVRNIGSRIVQSIRSVKQNIGRGSSSQSLEAMLNEGNGSSSGSNATGTTRESFRMFFGGGRAKTNSILVKPGHTSTPSSSSSPRGEGSPGNGSPGATATANANATTAAAIDVGVESVTLDGTAVEQSPMHIEIHSPKLSPPSPSPPARPSQPSQGQEQEQGQGQSSSSLTAAMDAAADVASPIHTKVDGGQLQGQELHFNASEEVPSLSSSPAEAEYIVTDMEGNGHGANGTDIELSTRTPSRGSTATNASGSHNARTFSRNSNLL